MSHPPKQSHGPIVIALKEPVVRLTSAREIARRGRGLLDPGHRRLAMAEELIAERRAEAKNE